jgi:signal transduction histidine kinase/ActR/RegA family two-component response regulator
MTLDGNQPQSRRVLVVAPTGKDGELTVAVLRNAAIEAEICPDISEALIAIEQGVGVLLIAEEAMGSGNLELLSSALSGQQPWSDLPVLLLTRYGADSPTVGTALRELTNVTLLERPVRPATLISSVEAGLKARERQYQIRAHLVEQKRTADSLREADRRKDEFLATLAHELRNPLAPIRNSLNILRLSVDKDPAAERICEMMERQVALLVRLVDDLMEVSRITRGKIELRKEPVELAAVIRSAVEASRPQIELGKHELAISIPPEPLVIDGDPVRLAQVFVNLLNNASKYMDDGGNIWIGAKREGEEVVVAVRDTGVGISAEMIPQIFQMFTQIDRSSRQAQGGLGIGLTLVRTLIEMHGGQVHVQSDGLGKGTEFTVRLPLTKKIPSPTKSAIPAVSSLPPRRVVIVDDNRDAASSLALLLKLLGLEVAVANRGLDALELLPTFRPAVVLLDIGMPGMDGYEVARRIREQLEFKDLILIALTGWGQEEDRRRTSDAGFDFHLIKPADINALETLLANLPQREKQ